MRARRQSVGLIVAAAVLLCGSAVRLFAVPSAPINLTAIVVGSTVTLTWNSTSVQPLFGHRLEAGIGEPIAKSCQCTDRHVDRVRGTQCAGRHVLRQSSRGRGGRRKRAFERDRCQRRRHQLHDCTAAAGERQVGCKRIVCHIELVERRRVPCHECRLARRQCSVLEQCGNRESRRHPHLQRERASRNLLHPTLRAESVRLERRVERSHGGCRQHFTWLWGFVVDRQRGLHRWWDC